MQEQTPVELDGQEFTSDYHGSMESIAQRDETADSTTTSSETMTFEDTDDLNTTASQSELESTVPSISDQAPQQESVSTIKAEPKQPQPATVVRPDFIPYLHLVFAGCSSLLVAIPALVVLRRKSGSKSSATTSRFEESPPRHREIWAANTSHRRAVDVHCDESDAQSASSTVVPSGLDGSELFERRFQLYTLGMLNLGASKKKSLTQGYDQEHPRLVSRASCAERPRTNSTSRRPS